MAEVGRKNASLQAWVRNCALAITVFLLIWPDDISPDFGRLSTEQRASALIECLPNRTILPPDTQVVQRNKLFEMLWSPGPDMRYLTISGKLGWHTTWLALIDLDGTRPRTYETCVDHNSGFGCGSFFQQKIPVAVQRALKASGAPVAGIHPTLIPEKTR